MIGVLVVLVVLEELDQGVDVVRDQNLVVNNVKVMTLKLKSATPKIVLVSSVIVSFDGLSLYTCDHH